MLARIAALLRLILQTGRDIAPIVLVVVFFQAVIVRQPMPDLGEKIGGAILVLVGLTLFVRGLAMSLFPLGEGLADALARRGKLWLLLVFSFALGFGSTVAEPALAAVTAQAASAAAAAGLVGGEPAEVDRYALLLRYAASAAVGLAVMIGALRIVKGWPLAWLVLGGYALAAVIAVATASPLAGTAFDAGAAATSAINIPLLAALGVGLASILRDRNPVVDGFGLAALASLMPMLTILIGTMVLGQGRP